MPKPNKLRRNAKRYKNTKRLADIPRDKAIKPKLDLSGLTGDVIDDGVAVRLDRVIVRGLLAQERESPRTLGGPLTIGINGRSTILRWGFGESGGLDCEFSRGRLLYAGNPGGVLDLDVSLIESDEHKKNDLAKMSGFLTFAAKIASVVPVYGAAVGAGLGFANALVDFTASQINNDLEMRYAGGFGPMILPGKALRQGVARVIRSRSGANQPDDIEIHLKIEKLAKASSLSPNKEVVVVLRGVMIDEKAFNVEPSDKVMLETTVAGASKPQTYSLTAEGFPKKSAWSKVINLINKPIYRGAWGRGLSVAIALQVIPNQVFEKMGPLLGQIQGFSSAIAPDRQTEIDHAIAVTQATSELLSAFVPNVRHSLGVSDLLVRTGEHIVTASSLEGVNATFFLDVINTGREVKGPPPTRVTADPPLPVKVMPN